MFAQGEYGGPEAVVVVGDQGEARFRFATGGDFESLGVEPGVLGLHEIHSVFFKVVEGLLLIEFKFHSGIIMVPFWGASREWLWLGSVDC